MSEYCKLCENPINEIDAFSCVGLEFVCHKYVDSEATNCEQLASYFPAPEGFGKNQTVINTLCRQCCDRLTNILEYERSNRT